MNNKSNTISTSRLTHELTQAQDLGEEDADGDGQLMARANGPTDLARRYLRQVQRAQGDVETWGKHGK